MVFPNFTEILIAFLTTSLISLIYLISNWFWDLWKWSRLTTKWSHVGMVQGCGSLLG